MSKIKINVYTNMDSIVEDVNLMAIYDNNIIKYIDLHHNHFQVDYNQCQLIKENDESRAVFDFKNGDLFILVKEFFIEVNKRIIVIDLICDNNLFFVKYKLIDDNIINEYKINFIKKD